MQMEAEEEIARVMQMYREIGDGNSDYKNIHNPVYVTLSKRLKMKKKKIYRIICETQPFVRLKRYGGSIFITQMKLKMNLLQNKFWC